MDRARRKGGRCRSQSEAAAENVTRLDLVRQVDQCDSGSQAKKSALDRGDVVVTEAEVCQERADGHRIRAVTGRCLLVLTRAPVQGRVKTRLIGDLSPSQATELHRAMVEDVVHEAKGGAYELIIAWALLPEESMPGNWPMSGLRSWRQAGTDLGERLFLALRRAGRSYSSLAAIGTDDPGLRRSRIEEAFDALDAGADVVLGPARDGGYYLIAMHSGVVHRRLFAGIEWGTEHVLEQTVERCNERGHVVHRLPAECDVDTMDDVRRLAAALRKGELQAPRTRALLEGWEAF